MDNKEDIQRKKDRNMYFHSGNMWLFHHSILIEILYIFYFVALADFQSIFSIRPIEWYSLKRYSLMSSSEQTITPSFSLRKNHALIEYLQWS
jgi:hypothetical protein